MNPEELHNIFQTEDQFWWYRGMRAITRSLLDAAAIPRGGTGLDVGCGTGFNAIRIQDWYGLKMFGLDLTPIAIRYCRQRGLERSVVGSASHLPYADGSFDFVSSFDMLTVLPQGIDQQALREFARVLRPGGLLFVRVAAFEALRSRHSQWIREYQRYTEPRMRMLLEPLGLKIVRSTYANSVLSPLALLKFRVVEPLFGAAPSSGVARLPARPLNALLTSVLIAEASLIRRGFRFAFGQSWTAVIQKPK